MAKFFNQLVEENLITEWAETLDWLFDDLKFSKERNWNSGYTGQFTKRLKRLHGLDKENYIYKNNSTIDFPSLMENNRNNRVPMIVMVQGDSAARDFIRHIRNGITHGHTLIFKVSDVLYIEILDFSGKPKSIQKQTAYICIPLSYITTSCQIYNEINRAIMNTKSTDRKQSEKYKKG